MKIFHILLISSSAFYCRMCKKIIIKKKIVHVAGQSLGCLPGAAFGNICIDVRYQVTVWGCLYLHPSCASAHPIDKGTQLRAQCNGWHYFKACLWSIWGFVHLGSPKSQSCRAENAQAGFGVEWEGGRSLVLMAGKKLGVEFCLFGLNTCSGFSDLHPLMKVVYLPTQVKVSVRVLQSAP